MTRLPAGGHSIDHHSLESADILTLSRTFISNNTIALSIFTRINIKFFSPEQEDEFL